eukprot:TRINITY_DN16310_c0_g1_i1.p1 TRINITY_DN16310_c0_g1~~TRINITY_DN16310_c0_g1_i1.p1  ORF type:complete len:397 (+),score=69.91 TRINITY_DN16310_c0_g1_i1:48-1238(+)
MIDAVDSLDGKGSTTFIGFTPLKTSVVDESNRVTDEVPSPYISKVGHRILVSVYFLLLAAYLGYAIYQYVTRPDVETYSQQPSELFPAPTITIKLQCFDNPNCGVIRLIRNYTTTSEMHCKNRAAVTTDETSRTLTEPIATELCYVEEDAVFSVNTGELIQTPGTVLDFSRITTGELNTSKAYAAVQVEVGGMRKLVTMDSWQVKTFYVGMSVSIKNGKSTVKYYAQNLQYDGKRPTWRATYIIRLAQFANVYEVTRPGSWLDILAQLGGAATFVAALLVLTEPVITKMFPGDEPRLQRGRMYSTRGKNFKKKSDGKGKDRDNLTDYDDSQLTSSLPNANSLKPSPFAPQERVQVLYEGRWHPATVTGIDGNRLNVLWDDGTVSTNVPSTAAKKEF